MHKPLAGTVAIITGAASSRGQGAAEARLFVEHGATVVLTDQADAEGRETASTIGSCASFRHLDVTSDAGWSDVVSEVVEKHGRIDVLVNNAGVWLAKGVCETTPAEYRRVVEVNQTGTFLGMRAVIPFMRDSGSGSIINISSSAGLRGGNMPHAYAASKWAVRGMTKAAASEFAPYGVRVNSIHPGLIDTAMLGGSRDEPAQRVPMGRLGRAEEVAHLAAFLASDASSYISGAEVTVDGAVTV